MIFKRILKILEQVLQKLGIIKKEPWYKKVLCRYLRVRPLSILLVLVVLVLGAYFLFFSSSEVLAEWWDTNWHYRKAITITNSGSAQTDFQVKVLADYDMSSDVTNGKVQADFDDLRFTDINGNALDYWIEDDTSSSLDVWVKISSIPTSTSTVYMYYGNPNASSVQSGDNTFEFFDDFSGTSLDTNKWVEKGDGSLEVSGGVIHTIGEKAIYGKSNISNIFDKYIEVRGKLKGASANDVEIGYGYISSSDLWQRSRTGEWIATLGWGNKGVTIAYGSGGRDCIDYISGELWDYLDYYNYRLKFENNRGRVWKGETSILDQTVTCSQTNSDLPLVIVFDHHQGTPNNDEYIDWVFVRKYAATEPTVGVQSEEKGPGPVGYWSFDEGYGTTAQDRTSNNNDGTITGATWQTEDMCVSGKCLYFDGSGNYVNMGDQAEFEFGADDFTVSAWIKANSFRFEGDQDRCAIYKFDWGPGQGWFLGASKGTKLQFYIRDGSNWSYAAGISKTTVTLNQWHHIVGIKEGSSVKFYYDGSLIQTASTSSVRTIPNTSQTLNVSKNSLTTGWDGFIDEVKIYDYARTADQIKADYNARAGSIGTSARLSNQQSAINNFSSGLVGYWKMDEASGNVLDASGNGNTGTPTGTTVTAGKFGNGRNFQSTSTDRVAFGDPSFFDFGNNDFSLSGWAKISGSLAIYRSGIITKWNTGASPGTNEWSFGVGTGTTKTPGFTVVSNSTSYSTHSPTEITSDEWHHIVGIRKDNYIYIYVDGIERNNTYVGNISIDNVSGRDMYIGNIYNNGGFDCPFDGWLDEIRVYNRALSAREVKALYEWAPGPVGHWKMDEASWTGVSGEVKDSSGYGNNGVRGGDATTYSPGKYGKAGIFDGTNDHVMIPDSATIRLDTKTVEMWVKVNNGVYTSANRPPFIVYANLGSSTNRFWLGMQSNHFKMHGWGTGDPECSTNINDGQWHHLAWSYDTVNQKMNMWVDGVQEVTNFNQTEGGIVGDSNNDWYFGRFHDHYSSFDIETFDGLIDDVRIYNYARTQKQILEDMNAGRPAQKSPVGYWKFDEGYGTSAKDSSGQGNNGTITGADWTNEGRFGKALSFVSANSDYVTVGDNPVLDGFSSASWSFWIKQNTHGKTIIDKYDCVSGGRAWRIFENGLGNLNLQISSDGINNEQQTTTGLNITNGIWSHIILVFDHGIFKAYENGIEATVDDNFSTEISIYAGSSGMDIGKRRTSCNSTGTYFNGIIDEVKIYNYALTEEEIKQEYNQGKVAVMGALSSDGATGSHSSALEYCVPGDTATCTPPVAEWNFEEHSGSYAYDSSGNGNTGTLRNMDSSDWSVGAIGSGLYFNENNDDVLLSSPFSKSGNEFTVSLWHKRSSHTSSSTYRTLLCRNGGTYHYLLYQPDQNNAEMSIYNSGRYGLGYNVPDDNKWHHYEVIYHSNSVDLYVDGIYRGSTSTMFDSVTYPLALIGNYSGGSQPAGYIDHVKIYDYARTPAQVAWDYNKGKPIAHWRFDEGQGTTIYDSSGNGNNGTLNLGSSGQTSAGSVKVNANTAWYNGRNGKQNYSLNFDGEDDYVSVVDDDNLDITDEITISMWVKPIYESGELTHLYKPGVTRFFFRMDDDYGRYIWTDIYDASDHTIKRWQVQQNPVMEENLWYHLAFTFGDAYRRIYENGNMIGERIEDFIIDVSADDLLIGKYGSNYFNGQIDDVRIYNYALTADQVKQVYNFGAARLGTGD